MLVYFSPQTLKSSNPQIRGPYYPGADWGLAPVVSIILAPETEDNIEITQEITHREEGIFMEEMPHMHPLGVFERDTS